MILLAFISYQEMNFKDILHKFRTESFTEKEKGTKFERLMRSWLLTDPRYNELEKVWLWEEFRDARISVVLILE